MFQFRRLRQRSNCQDHKDATPTGTVAQVVAASDAKGSCHVASSHTEDHPARKQFRSRRALMSLAEDSPAMSKCPEPVSHADGGRHVASSHSGDNPPKEQIRTCPSAASYAEETSHVVSSHAEDHPATEPFRSRRSFRSRATHCPAITPIKISPVTVSHAEDDPARKQIRTRSASASHTAYCPAIKIRCVSNSDVKGTCPVTRSHAEDYPATKRIRQHAEDCPAMRPNKMQRALASCAEVVGTKTTRASRRAVGPHAEHESNRNGRKFCKPNIEWTKHDMFRQAWGMLNPDGSWMHHPDVNSEKPSNLKPRELDVLHILYILLERQGTVILMNSC